MTLLTINSLFIFSSETSQRTDFAAFLMFSFDKAKKGVTLL